MNETPKIITFIIGNGFDCKYKLHTSYTHFLDYYLGLPSATTAIERFKEEIRGEKGASGYGTWSYLERRMGSYSPDTLEAFIECYDDITAEMVRYLRYVEANNVGLSEEDLDKVDLFPEGFMHFLINFLRIHVGEQQQIHQLHDAYRQYNKRYNFIELNYTSVLSSCLKELQKTEKNRQLLQGEERVTIGRHLQPHGNLDSIVFGVSDSNQANLDFVHEREYRRRIIKSERIADLGKTWLAEGRYIIAESDVVAIYGTSLGETDNHWWRMVAEWLAAGPQRHLIIYYYMPQGSAVTAEQYEAQKREKEMQIKSQFASFIDTMIITRISVTFEEQRFVEMFLLVEPKPITIGVGLSVKAELIPGPHSKSAR